MEECLLITQFEYNATATNCFKTLTNHIDLCIKPHADAWQANKGSHTLIMHFVFYTESSTKWQLKLRWLYTGLLKSGYVTRCWNVNCDLCPSSIPYQQSATTALRQVLAVAMCTQPCFHPSCNNVWLLFTRSGGVLSLDRYQTCNQRHAEFNFVYVFCDCNEIARARVQSMRFRLPTAFSSKAEKEIGTFWHIGVRGHFFGHTEMPLCFC
jgi:hypothetical protein